MSASSSVKTTHLERTATEPRTENLYKVKLCQVQQATRKVRLLRLCLPASIQFQAGQWLDTYVPGIPQAGGFTITSPPAAAADQTSPYLELAVQKSPGNPPAAWLWGQESEILKQTLHVRVGGSFTFPPGRGLDGIHRVVFIAGGVGINPIMSMLSHIGQSWGGGSNEQTRFDPAIELKVAYASRVGEGGVGEVLFLPRITELLRGGHLNGSLTLFLTGSGSVAGHPGCQLQNRRIASEDLRALLNDPKHCLVYICGPPTMTDDMESFLTSSDGLGMNPSHVITEKWW